MKNYQKIIIGLEIGIILFCGVGIYQKVFASIIAQQTDYSAQGNGGGGWWVQSLGILSGVVQKLEVKVENQYGTYNPSIAFYNDTTATSTFFSYDCGAITTSTDFWSPLDTCNDNQGNFLIDYTFDGVSNYSFGMGNVSYQLWYGSIDPNSYPNGECTSGCYGLDGGDFYFIIGSASSTASSIIIDYPTSTTTINFAKVFVSGYAFPLTGFDLSNNLSVMYAIDTTSSTLDLPWRDNPRPQATEILYPPFSQSGNFSKSIPISGLINSDHYYLRAWLIQWNSTGMNFQILATSNIVDFTITSQGGIYNPTWYPAPTSTTNLAELENASSTFYVDCSAYNNIGFFTSSTFGMIGCQTQKILYGFMGWLITPTTNITNFFKDSLSKLTLTFPFNLFYGLNTTIQNNLTQTATSSDLTATIWGQSVVIIGDTTLVDIFGQSAKDLIFNIIIALAWVGAGILVYLVVV